MTSKTQLEERIQNLETELSHCKRLISSDETSTIEGVCNDDDDNDNDDDAKQQYHCIGDAAPGDTLRDGSIVIQKSNPAKPVEDQIETFGIVLLMAPKKTEIETLWIEGFPDVFAKLKEYGFNPVQWFIPTEEHLAVADKTIPNEFDSTYYWSSTSSHLHPPARFTFHEYFADATDDTKIYCTKTPSLRVRAFRCVTYRQMRTLTRIRQ